MESLEKTPTIYYEDALVWKPCDIIPETFTVRFATDWNVDKAFNPLEDEFDIKEEKCYTTIEATSLMTVRELFAKLEAD